MPPIRGQSVQLISLAGVVLLVMGWSLWRVRHHAHRAEFEMGDALLIGLIIVAVMALGLFLIDALAAAH